MIIPQSIRSPLRPPVLLLEHFIRRFLLPRAPKTKALVGKDAWADVSADLGK